MSPLSPPMLSRKLLSDVSNKPSSGCAHRSPWCSSPVGCQFKPYTPSRMAFCTPSLVGNYAHFFPHTVLAYGATYTLGFPQTHTCRAGNHASFTLTPSPFSPCQPAHHHITPARVQSMKQCHATTTHHTTHALSLCRISSGWLRGAN
jgi:hypothetical protein